MILKSRNATSTRVLETHDASLDTSELTRFKEAVEAGLNDIEDGKTIPHHQVKDQLNAWLTR